MGNQFILSLTYKIIVCANIIYYAYHRLFADISNEVLFCIQTHWHVDIPSKHIHQYCHLKDFTSAHIVRTKPVIQ
jgi:hypothetical protein